MDFQESEKINLPDDTVLFNDVIDEIRWFLLPSEAKSFLEGKSSDSPNYLIPFKPPLYPLTPQELNKMKTDVWITSELFENRLKNMESFISKSKGNIQNKENIITSNNSKTSKKTDDVISIRNDDKQIVPIEGDSVNSNVEKSSKVEEVHQNLLKDIKMSTNIVCEDDSCFRLREDEVKITKPNLIKSKWHSPPKNIFNTTIDVSTVYKYIIIIFIYRFNRFI